MNPILQYFNKLLPFATPGTPLIQDLSHLAAICILLYFAPQIQNLFQRARPGQVETALEPEPAGEGPLLPDVANVEAEPEVQEPVAEPGPPQVDNVNDHAEPAQRANLPNQRAATGAKKVKSLARKDQRRAYNEWLRSEGDLQRARDAEGAEEREKVAAAIREKRREAEAAIQQERLDERRRLKMKEDHQRREELLRRERAISIVKQDLEVGNACDLFRVAKQLGGDVDEEWVEHLLAASGVLGKKENSLTMVTQMGWAVRVSAEDVQSLYTTAVEEDVGMKDETVDYEMLGMLLEGRLRP